MTTPGPAAGRRRAAARPGSPTLGSALGLALGPTLGSVLDGLDPDQHAAATAPGPLLIIAGPGTGKTRTLTHRIAHQVVDSGLPAGEFLAITFTRRAAQEMRDRLAALCPDHDQLTVTTFHGLGLRILREQHAAAGLPEAFGVADEAAMLAVATELTGSDRDARRLLAGLDDDPDGRLALRKELLARDLVDFDSLVEMSAALVRDSPEIAAGLRSRWPRISVDEYQDIDAVQYDLLRSLSGDGAGLTAIGDPDQSIYGFRGADAGIFGRFAARLPRCHDGGTQHELPVDPAIVTAALQAIAPTTLVPGADGAARRPGQPPEWPARPGCRPGWLAGQGALELSRSIRPPTSMPRPHGSRPRLTSSWAAPRSIPWTAAGPTGTVTASSGSATSPSCTAPTRRPGRSRRR